MSCFLFVSWTLLFHHYIYFVPWLKPSGPSILNQSNAAATVSSSVLLLDVLASADVLTKKGWPCYIRCVRELSACGSRCSPHAWVLCLWAAVSARMDPLNHCTTLRLMVQLRSEKPRDTDTHWEEPRNPNTHSRLCWQSLWMPSTLCGQQRSSTDHSTTPFFALWIDTTSGFSIFFITLV